MFFKKSRRSSAKSSDQACWVTFTFWGLILLINSITEHFFQAPFISSSMLILFLGLVLFFISDFIFESRYKKNRPV
ncbi:hypothetical protein CR205_10360 [Alteribacter lacisalsi]|uniref:Uncharacterized protein n=1 Tax=Alteribacter lacisalsi TaxID=2045244 RepID=A0A2W0HCN3_9BACI|nr:hypothetical protein CR205_10360 [Alteribacter lacisalsi]